MRIPFNDLEELRADPQAFRRRVEQGLGSAARGGRYAIMQNALLQWHKGGVALGSLRADMIAKCEQRYRPGAELQEVIRAFDEYVMRHQATGADTRLTRLRVQVPLPVGADPRFTISGQVRRLDRHPDGTYTAWMFSNKRSDWACQLRLPLIQEATRASLNLEPDEIDVGVYCFADGADPRFSFDEAQVAAALQELGQLLSELVPLVANEKAVFQLSLGL